MLDQPLRVGFFLLLACILAAPAAAEIPLWERLEGARGLVPGEPEEIVPQTGPSDGTGPQRDPSNDDAPPEGEPEESSSEPSQSQAAIDLARKARATARETAEPVVQQITSLLPRDPVGYLENQLQPVRGTADEIQAIVFYSEATPDGEPVAPASATLTEIDLPREALIVAGATAAAAAAIALLWLAGSSGSVGAGAAGASGTGAKLAATDLRRLLPFASPLFTRFEKDTVLGHPKREALYALILQAPGVSLQSLCDSTGLSRTAVTHHLRLLELQHLVVSKRVGRSRHYYENGGRFGRDQKEALAVLQNPRSKEVAAFVKDHPGAIQKALCQALGLQPSIAHWHLQRLQQALLVEAVRSGRTVSYFPGGAMKGMDQPVVPAAALAAAPTA